jgi:hypothetical protein
VRSTTHGVIVITRTCMAYLNEHRIDPLPFLQRHMAGDWGDMSANDKKANQVATTDGSRLFSSYRLPNEDKLWIITDAADEAGVRHVTTVLLPDDY